MTKVNIYIEDSLSCEDPENITEFKNLHVDITHDKVLFKKMIQHIVKSISDTMINFVNVSLICENIELFT